MSFLKIVNKKWNVSAVDGPDFNTAPSGASNPENWVSKLQTGKSQHELKADADRLHELVTSWQDTSLEAYDIFTILNANGGKHFEMYSPILLKGMSRKKLLSIAEICSKIAEQAPII